MAAHHARAAVEQIKQEARFQTWTVLPSSLALGFALGAFGTYYFFTRQVAALNDRFDHLQQLLVTPVPVSQDIQAPAAVDQEETWAAPKAGYGFDAQALGTSKERSSHKPTASTAG